MRNEGIAKGDRSSIESLCLDQAAGSTLGMVPVSRNIKVSPSDKSTTRTHRGRFSFKSQALWPESS